jgi:hypothetical protein
MALLKKIKKGGLARWWIKGATSGDYFTVPRGFKVLDALIVENATQLAGTGTISLGKVPGVNDVYTVPVTSAITTAGTITFQGSYLVSTPVTVTSAQATAIAALSGGVTGALQLAASAALVASLAQALGIPNVFGVSGNVYGFNITSSGANIIFTGAVPGPSSGAPSIGMGATAMTVGSYTHTTTGSVDTTYLSPSWIPATTANSVSLVPFVSPPSSSGIYSSLTNSSYNGNNITTTLTYTSTAAGTYNLCGQTVTIPFTSSFGLTAPQMGMVLGGRSMYVATMTWVASTTMTINGVSIATGINQTAWNVNLNNATVPGWLIFASGSNTTVFFFGTRPGATPIPTIAALGTNTVVTVYSQLGFTIPQYVNDSITPVTNTVTITNAGSTSTAGLYAINGTLINMPAVATTALTVAQSCAIAAGCAFYYFNISSSSAGTNYINGAQFTASGTAATTAALFASGSAMYNVPGKPGDVGGWTCSNPGTTYVVMIAQTPGYMSIPTFSAGAVAAPVLAASPVFQQGFTFNGYTISYTGSTVVYVGPSPVFQNIVAFGSQTTAQVCTWAGSTGIAYTYTDLNNPGGQPPYFAPGTTAPATTTYSVATYPNDVNYYINFSNPALHGNVNVTMQIEKFS